MSHAAICPLFHFNSIPWQERGKTRPFSLNSEGSDKIKGPYHHWFGNPLGSHKEFELGLFWLHINYVSSSSIHAVWGWITERWSTLRCSWCKHKLPIHKCEQNTTLYLYNCKPRERREGGKTPQTNVITNLVGIKQLMGLTAFSGEAFFPITDIQVRDGCPLQTFLAMEC